MNRIISNIRIMAKATKGYCGNEFATMKLGYGQGGSLDFNLTKRNYQIQFETVWEDYCLIDINGLSGSNSISIEQDRQSGKSSMSDRLIEKIDDEQVSISIKIPEDFTFQGIINGSIHHTKSQVTNKLRCYNTKLNLTGNKRVFQWGSLETPELNIMNQEGAIDIRSVTFQNGIFRCRSFSSQKVLLSEKMDVISDYSINCRSIVTYGNAIALLKTQYLNLDSISGKSEVEADKVKIDRIWGSPNGISIKAKQIQKIGIETGSGYIHSQEKLDINKVTLGRLHKGKIIPIDDNSIKIT